MLDDLDKALEARGYRHVRYADDLVVLLRDRSEAKQALAWVKEVLGELKLSLHETKTKVTGIGGGFTFLGFQFRGRWISIAPKAIERLKDKVRYLTRRQQGRNVEAVLAKLNPLVRGWARYYGVADVWGSFNRLDRWLRMRIRSFKLKRRCKNDNWRLPNRKLERWGMLLLQQCRPTLRFSSMGMVRP